MLRDTEGGEEYHAETASRKEDRGVQSRESMEDSEGECGGVYTVFVKIPLPLRIRRNGRGDYYFIKKLI